MGKPIEGFPDEVSYVVQAWFPEMKLWSPIITYEPDTVPDPAKTKRALDNINGMRAKGSKRITRLRTLKRLTFIGVEYTEAAL